MAFCTNCGTPLSEGGRFCPQCGAEIQATVVAPVQEPVVEAEPEPVPVPTPEPVSEPEPAPVQEVAPVAQPVSKPETKPAPLTNYLPRAIVMSILLFPTGIAAIVHAAKAQTAYIQGQYDLAERENELAARWCKKTVIAGIIFWAAFILFYMILIIAALA